MNCNRCNKEITSLGVLSPTTNIKDQILCPLCSMKQSEKIWKQLKTSTHGKEVL